MKSQPVRNLSNQEKPGPIVRIPLLCWDIAHPQLGKYQELASDLSSFARLAADLNWQWMPELRHPLNDGQTVVVTDRSSRVVWVSRGFSRLTGYQAGEMLGKTPALLQGPLTNTATRAFVRQRLARCESVTATIQNYRKDRTPYWCRITIDPLFNKLAECTHFMAVEEELPKHAR